MPLLLGVTLALLMVNSKGHELFETIHYQLHFAINEVGMVFFFALVAKEIREATLPGGPLHSFRAAAMPLVATIGGMMGPALVVVVVATATGQKELLRGWAIPTATDIAFAALLARLVFGKGHPAIAFLLTLAIADDAGGIVLLSLFYTETSPTMLLQFAAFVGVAIAIAIFMRSRGENKWQWYVLPMAVSWVGFYSAGFHPALSALPIVWCMPHERRDRGIYASGEDSLPDALNRMEHSLNPWVQWVLLPLFGFLNGGVELNGGLGPGTWMVLLGLVIGKPVGIFSAVLLGRALGLKLPVGMSTRDALVMGTVAGIGFTVALFVATVALSEGGLLNQAKLGALLSLPAAAIVAFALRVFVGGSTKTE